jgi:prepilin-type N-terminal cleavage/methylation domain-containing protein
MKVDDMSPQDRRISHGYSLIELLVVVGLVAVISAMAVPMMSNTLGDFRLRGDARGLNNATSLTKLRAASTFSQSRLYVDLNANTFRTETWQKTPPAWVADAGNTYLSSNVRFGFAPVATPPPNSQAVLAQAPACVNTTGAAIANTACLLFNSRGIPVDPSGAPPNVGAPTTADAVYLTDGTAVYAVTVSATGMVQLWRTVPLATPSWVLQ